jgi:hypothetical protein
MSPLLNNSGFDNLKNISVKHYLNKITDLLRTKLFFDQLVAKNCSFSGFSTQEKTLSPQKVSHHPSGDKTRTGGQQRTRTFDRPLPLLQPPLQHLLNNPTTKHRQLTRFTTDCIFQSLLVEVDARLLHYRVDVEVLVNSDPAEVSSLRERFVHLKLNNP